MTIENACKLLDIDILNITNMTNEQLKKIYHKMALQHHPDKNGNTIEATQYFQKINESYHYLSTVIDCNTDKSINTNSDFVSSFNSESKDYSHLLSWFIENIMKGKENCKDMISNIIQTIVIGCKDISLKLFEELDKDKSLEIYNFLCKYKGVLYIHDTVIQKVRDIIISKFKNDEVYILNPTLDDLFENNIYKLFIEEEMFLVPLWHNEIYFDARGREVIVFCIPDLPENVSIDDQNNIIIDVTYSLTNELLSLKNSCIEYVLTNKQIIHIPVNQLFIKAYQKYILKARGISKIIDEDIYNIKQKSDIIFRVTFE